MSRCLWTGLRLASDCKKRNRSADTVVASPPPRTRQVALSRHLHLVAVTTSRFVVFFVSCVFLFLFSVVPRLASLLRRSLLLHYNDLKQQPQSRTFCNTRLNMHTLSTASNVCFRFSFLSVVVRSTSSAAPASWRIAPPPLRSTCTTMSRVSLTTS